MKLSYFSKDLQTSITSPLPNYTPKLYLKACEDHEEILGALYK